MKDLLFFLPNVDITMFADDTSFAKAFKDVNEIKEHLVPAFSKICRWLKFNKLSLNTVNPVSTGCSTGGGGGSPPFHKI